VEILRTAPFAALALIAWAPAIAQPNPSPMAVKAGSYKIEPDHTRVLFSVSHLGFTTYYGEFVGAAGTLDLDPANTTASRLDVSVPVAGVMTPSKVLDNELKSADWLDAAKFPTISFRSTAVKQTSADTAQVSGDLTLHGVTRPETLTVKFNTAGVNPLDKAYTTGFEARGLIKRSDFGVTKYIPLVGDRVTLIISAAFERTGS
jgi:polyisoprenoid-binding protein YceI